MTKRVNRPHFKPGRKPKGENHHTVSGDLVEMTMASGDIVRFDRSDLSLVLPLRWVRTGPTEKPCASSRRRGEGDIKMHRLIMGITDPQIQVDHINHDTLDNQRCNLRVATKSQNTSHRRIPMHNSSGYLGVYKKDGHWAAQIEASCGHRRIAFYLGTYDSQDEAAKVRDAAAIKLQGEFATLNFAPHEIMQYHTDAAERLILRKLKLIGVSFPLLMSTDRYKTGDKASTATKALPATS